MKKGSLLSVILISAVMTACGGSVENEISVTSAADTVSETATQALFSETEASSEETEISEISVTETETEQTTGETTEQTTEETTEETTVYISPALDFKKTMRLASEGIPLVSAPKNIKNRPDLRSFRSFGERRKAGADTLWYTGALHVSPDIGLPAAYDFIDESFIVKWEGREELTNLLEEAGFLYNIVIFFSRWNDSLDYLEPDYDTFYPDDGVKALFVPVLKTGVSYDSFYRYLKTLFTDDFIDIMFSEGIFGEKDGELYGMCLETGINPIYAYSWFEIENETDGVITLKFTGYGSDGEGDSYTNTAYYDVYKTPDGLRLDDFDMFDYFWFHENE